MTDLDGVKNALTGPIASVSTPFCRDGSIDFKGLRNCIDFIIQAGSGTVLLTYGDSLYSILTDMEITEITRIAVDQTSKRAMVVAAGKWWTGASVEFARFARETGADMFMTLPPDWAQSATPQTLALHYEAIAKEIPVMIVTALGTRPVPLETFRILLEKQTGVIAVKDDICGPYARRMASLIDGRWAILSGGCKENYLDLMPYGADGYLSAYMRFRPCVSHDFWKAVKAGDISSAAGIISKYEIPFFEDLTVQLCTDFDALVHASMEVFGVAERWRRPPYKNLNDDQMEKVRDFFRS